VASKIQIRSTLRVTAALAAVWPQNSCTMTLHSNSFTTSYAQHLHTALAAGDLQVPSHLRIRIPTHFHIHMITNTESNFNSIQLPSHPTPPHHAQKSSKHQSLCQPTTYVQKFTSTFLSIKQPAPCDNSAA
jgi:hypothetical protein